MKKVNTIVPKLGVTKTNIYKVTYDESVAAALKDLPEEYKKAVDESKTVAHLVKAQSLREALDKAEGQELKYFKVFNVELKETQINLI